MPATGESLEQDLRQLYTLTAPAGAPGLAALAGASVPLTAGLGWARPTAAPTVQPMATTVASGRRAGGGPARPGSRVVAAATNLPAGSYTVVNTYVNGYGQTTVGPGATQALGAGQQLQATASGVPQGAVSVGFWLTAAPGGVNLGLFANVATFSGSAVGTLTSTTQGNGASPPASNTAVATGENEAAIYAKANGNTISDRVIETELRKVLTTNAHTANLRENVEETVLAGGGVGVSAEQELLKTGLTGWR